MSGPRISARMTSRLIIHALTWSLCAIGVALLFRAGRRADVPWSAQLRAGSALGGWGLFSCVEALTDHPLLGIHHVHSGDAQLACSRWREGDGAPNHRRRVQFNRS